MTLINFIKQRRARAAMAATLALTTLARAACGSPNGLQEADFNSNFSSLEQIRSSSFSWPRTLSSPAGEVSVDGPAQRILTLSAGHDEMVLALLGNDTSRLAGVGSATPAFSNIGALVEGLPAVGKDAEQVLALEPDIVILDRFTQADFAAQLTTLGLKVFQTTLDDQDFNIPNILLLGYLLGQEQNALRLVEQLRERLDAVAQDAPAAPLRGVILSKYQSIWANGDGSTGGHILAAAGIANAAAAVPADNGFVSLEAVAEFNPDVILVSAGGQAFIDEISGHPALAPVPAVRNGRIHEVTPLYYSSLSHWTVCGVEEAAKTAYAQRLAQLEVCPAPDYTE